MKSGLIVFKTCDRCTLYSFPIVDKGRDLLVFMKPIEKNYPITEYFA
jgi:hypothetical protein